MKQSSLFGAYSSSDLCIVNLLLISGIRTHDIKIVAHVRTIMLTSYLFSLKKSFSYSLETLS